MSRYGRQPALRAVRRHMLSRGNIAWLVGTDERVLDAALRGAAPPTDRMPDRLAIVLDEPPERLFTPAALGAARRAER